MQKNAWESIKNVAEIINSRSSARESQDQQNLEFQQRQQQQLDQIIHNQEIMIQLLTNIAEQNVSS